MAFDIEEFFGPQVGSEARFGYDIVSESKSHAGGYGRIAAVSNVGVDYRCGKRRVFICNRRA